MVFRYYSVSYGAKIVLDCVEIRDGERFVFGHNEEQKEEPKAKEPGILGGEIPPFYEFSAIVVKGEDGQYRLKALHHK